MKRVLIGELKQETATFNPAPTVYDDFTVLLGDELIEARRETKTEIAGALQEFSLSGCNVVPTAAASAVSGGPIRQADLERLIDLLIDTASDESNIDGIYLSLHGAMAGEDEGDPEGLLLSRIRDRFPETPLVASLDLHAVLTDRMIQSADILTPYHTYPHTDHFETGQRAARNLIQLMQNQTQPTVARVELPMLVRGDELLTATGLFGKAIEMCREFESSDGGLSAGVLIGNAFTDVPSLQSNVLVTTDNDLERANQVAERIGRFMWEHRESFQAELMSLEDSIQQANVTEGLVVFSDAADATASGAAGDSNAILEALLQSKFTKTALAPIVDAGAVSEAFQAGVGARIKTTVGGTRDRTRFRPISVDVKVCDLFSGGFQYEDGTRAKSGRVAVLQTGSITILVTERPVYVVGRRVFEAHGLNPVDFDLVVVKSPNGFRTWYESIAALIVPVDAPGSTSANLRSLPFRHCVRPIFPLDENVPCPFEPSPT